MSNDLSAIGHISDTARVPLYHPASNDVLHDDEGGEMWVEVYGSDSEHFRAVDREITNRNLAKMKRGRNQLTLSAEQVEAQTLERLVKSVKDWNVVVDGEKPECTEANVREVLNDYPWVRDQVEDAVYDRANFLAKS